MVALDLWYGLLAVIGFLILTEIVLFTKKLIETKILVLKKEELQKTSIKLKKTESLYVLITATAVTLLIMAAEFFVRKPESAWLGYLGLALMLVGGIIINVARAELGKYFTWQLVIFKKHKLVKTGIYSKIRHPSYLGIILILAGTALFLNTLFGMVMVVIFFVPASLYAIAEEEEALEEEFGQEYFDYKAKTKKLIPGIY